VVDVLICRLREKLIRVLGRDVIRTARGLGYVFDDGAPNEL
jgi:DNA-binding response OmpR family regulator